MTKEYAFIFAVVSLTYGLAEGCAFVKRAWEDAAIPFSQGIVIDPDRSYRILDNKHGVEMSLPGYEIARRGPNVPLEEAVRNDKEKSMLAQKQE